MHYALNLPGMPSHKTRRGQHNEKKQLGRYIRQLNRRLHKTSIGLYTCGFHVSKGTATLIVSYAPESKVIYCSRKAVDESRGDPAELAAADVHSELLHVCLQSIPKQMSKRPLTN